MAGPALFFQTNLDVSDMPDRQAVTGALRELLTVMETTASRVGTAMWDTSVADLPDGTIEVSYCVDQVGGKPSVEIFRDLLPGLVEEALTRSGYGEDWSEYALYMSQPYLGELTPGGV